MRLRVGYEMIYEFPQPTPMLMVLGTHFTRASDVIVPDSLTTDPVVPIPYSLGSPWRAQAAISKAIATTPATLQAWPTPRLERITGYSR